MAIHEPIRHCERSEAIHDVLLHGLPRYARSDAAIVRRDGSGFGELATTVLLYTDGKKTHGIYKNPWLA